MQQNNLEIFVDVFTVSLSDAIDKYPTEYGYPKSEVPQVVARMKPAFEKGTYNKDSRAIKQTCKVLNLKHTYQVINAFLSEVK